MADITWTNDTRRLSQLIPWPRNPRQIKGEQVRRLQESFLEFGQPDVEKWNAPPTCPIGLFGQDIAILRLRRSHCSDKHGNSGMIYWQPFEHLRFIAKLDEINVSQAKQQAELWRHGGSVSRET